jgi:hypothetical protein
MISPPLTHLLSGLEFIFNHFLILKNFLKTRTWSNLFAVCILRFQIHQKLDRDILCLLYQPTIPGKCRFDQQILTFLSHRYCGLVSAIHKKLEIPPFCCLQSHSG